MKLRSKISSDPAPAYSSEFCDRMMHFTNTGAFLYDGQSNLMCG